MSAEGIAVRLPVRATLDYICNTFRRSPAGAAALGNATSSMLRTIHVSVIEQQGVGSNLMLT